MMKRSRIKRATCLRHSLSTKRHPEVANYFVIKMHVRTNGPSKTRIGDGRRRRQV
uniref:Uncharacterized protein n=1 Tax=Hyaloperonospora arabidopsidis (strain Emoy2) TaxID=559515 RepID=M4BUH5_HYAAE